jgi:hypothetical protein
MLLAMPAVSQTVRWFVTSQAGDRIAAKTAVRVGVTGSMDGVRCLVFQSKDGSMVVELLNSRNVPARVQLKLRGNVLPLDLPALSIGTCLW